jgi:small-conductance mechanosensitive channel
MPSFVTDMTREVFRLWREFYWLPEWAVITVIVAVFVFIGWAANQLVFALLKLAVRKRDVFWRGTVGRARLKVRIAVMIAALALAVTVSPLHPEPSLAIRQTLLFAFILNIGWMLIGASDMWAVVYLRRFNMASEDNLLARKHVTQARILQRVAALLIGIVTLGLALLTIAEVRQWGLSLLASAGVVGIIAGLALQPFLTNMMAGIQIATAQPIRLDDAVIVEGEAGVIEEITSTYVVVKLWDWRRMVLPLSYFINTPFQNWTRDSTRLIGSAFLHVDYEAPIDRLRAELERICRASLFWDGDVVSLQVTDVTDRTAQVRCLASARNAGSAFDLRCEIREKMLAYMRDQCPEALPRERFAADRISSPDAAPPGRS